MHINNKAKEIADGIISKRELEAIRSEKRIKDKLSQLESIITQIFNMSLEDFLSEISKQDNPKTIIKEMTDNHEKYRE